MGVAEVSLRLPNSLSVCENHLQTESSTSALPSSRVDRDQVVLCDENRIENPPVAQPSFFTRAVQWAVNLGRGLVNIVKWPFCKAFELVQGCRVSSSLQELSSERGSDNDSLKAFHVSHEFNLSNPDNERALFRYYRSNSDKPAVILTLGNSQNFDDDNGINRLAQRLNREGHPVLILRSGNFLRGVPFALGLSSNPLQNTEFRYESGRQIINDFRARRGLFSDVRSTNCVLGGYSLGARAIVRYSQEESSNTDMPPIAGMVLDHIGNPLELGVAGRDRLRVNGPVLNVHQDNSYCLNGEPHDEHNSGDVTLCFSDETHDTIDERAVESSLNFIRRIVNQAKGNLQK